MTDREMLEAAAKAMGIVGNYFEGTCTIHTGIYRARERYYWNPLESDSEALRLAVKLGITIDMHLERVRAYADETPKTAEEFFGTDPLAATRRVIVRAAAALGAAS